MRILTIEDDSDLRTLVERTLTRHGHEVIGAGDLAAGGALLAAETWDLLLLDYRLPDGTADSLISQYRELRRELPPFVVMTGQGDERVAVRVMQAGAREYLLKDTTLLELLPHVTRRIQRSLEQEKELSCAREVLRQQQKLKAIGTLAAGIAHEINNPIAIIQNASELILDDAPEGSDIHENARMILQAGERTAAIVRNLLAFARPDHGATRTLLPVTEIIDGTLFLIRRVLEKDGIAIEVELPAPVPRASCRLQQLQQVLMNLLTNARDALVQGGTVDGAPPRIRILASVHRGDEAATWIRLTVENNGPAIDGSLRARIFDPFYTTKTRDAGTGLGLSVSHGILEDHGGRLHVDSDHRGWTRFHADLPWDPAAIPERTRQEGP